MPNVHYDQSPITQDSDNEDDGKQQRDQVGLEPVLVGRVVVGAVVGGGQRRGVY